MYWGTVFGFRGGFAFFFVSCPGGSFLAMVLLDVCTRQHSRQHSGLNLMMPGGWEGDSDTYQ